MFVDALLILGLALAGSQGPHTDATRQTRLRYTVQIQSAPATQRERLRETYEALKAKGHLVYCRDAWIHERAYVRLRVGLFTSSEEAGRYGETIHEQEGFDYFVARANLSIESFGTAFDVITTANDIWFRSDTCLRPLYHFDTAEASMTCSGIAVSPTGRCIAFSCDNKIVKIDLQDDSITVLKTGHCDDSLFNSVLAWSPDGRHIAYLDAMGWELPTKLWIMQSDGNNDRRLVGDDTGQTRVKSLQWRPSGQEVFYVSGPAHGTVSAGGSLCGVGLGGRGRVVVPACAAERTEVCSEFRIVGNEIHYQLAHFDAQCQVRQHTAHKTAIPR